MRIRENVSLAELTTLRVGGTARYVLSVEAPEDIVAALAFVRERGVPFVALGEGSNVLPPDEGYEGAIFRMQIPGISFAGNEGAVRVTAGAGVAWDEFVRMCAERSLWGVENLAGIPGTVGAAPVQNIGAYGAEVKHVIASVTAYDADANQWRTLDASACEFTYRDSRFKREPNLIISSVEFTLRTDGSPRVEYADLMHAREGGADLSTPEAIGRTVRSVRAGKFPDLTAYGTAGSFFKNPFVSQEAYDALSLKFAAAAEAAGGIPRYPVPGQVKIPLAFILDKFLGMRGYRKGNAFLFGNQPLVLVAERGAFAHDVDELAREIEMRVKEATGISIEREVRDLIFHEYRAHN